MRSRYNVEHCKASGVVFPEVKPFRHQLSVGGRSRKVFDPLAT